ncbi:MAG TPA: AbrB/MazE/SpoVT family DNA-binding domain-containing protein [Acidimicrobiia bacterium]|nr:AbrB/MazE/SpoVT family DNA-binding domain-containing protein [Acidimicrobiia bacterium]
MMSERVLMNEQGRIVIPAAYRRVLGLVGGDELVIRVENGSLRIQRIEDVVAEAQQIVSRYVADTRSLVDELIDERRKAAEAE